MQEGLLLAAQSIQQTSDDGTPKGEKDAGGAASPS
jgi:hypothetical protein